MNIEYIATVILVILVSMTLHEAMHAFVSYWLGDDTAKAQGRLTLNPISHIDPFLTIILPVMLAIAGAPIIGGAKPVPFNPDNVRGGEWGAALVAVAGPLTNFVLAFVCFGLAVIFGLVTASGFDVSSFVGLLLMTGVYVNLGFFVFNMLPIPPLDGSRLMYALAPEFVRRGMEAIERFGVFIVLAIVLLANAAIGSFIGSVISALVSFFASIYQIG